ncbi:ABC-2 transporter permease [Evtepia sp.]|uniref:ABC-2 transporter permease n=1 Tax=Evtepia sp. TaxID=2773933 RepID=UPI002E7800BE|nr:ABC-2 transporter permease [Evtepia sp.]MEE0748148.1 ABC-2 transporter permease [Evtepia sp.]
MKALLYKDACVLWKQMKFMLVIIAVFCLLPNSFGLNAFFVVYAGLMLPVSLMAYDERAHWDSFAAMLPYPPRALVLSRYAAGWLLTLLAGVLYLVGALIQDQGAPLGTALGTLGWVLAVVLLCQAILFPFFFRVGTEQGRLYMILLSVLLLLGGVGLTSLLNVAVPAVSTLLMLAPVGLGVALAACLASVPVAVGQYAKRTW